MIRNWQETYQALCEKGFDASEEKYKDMLFDYWIELVYNNRKQDAMELENAFKNQGNNFLQAKGIPEFVVEQMTSDVDFQTVRKTLFDIQENRKNYDSTNLILATSTNHVLASDYSEVIVVGAGADAVDYKLISICHKGDIVVSQDYGVAAMALGKGVYAIHQSGKWYTNENIDQMLMERHLNKKARRASGKNHLKGPRKRISEDDEHFRESFEKMIHMAMDKEN